VEGGGRGPNLSNPTGLSLAGGQLSFYAELNPSLNGLFFQKLFRHCATYLSRMCFNCSSILLESLYGKTQSVFLLHTAGFLMYKHPMLED